MATRTRERGGVGGGGGGGGVKVSALKANRNHVDAIGTGCIGTPTVKSALHRMKSTPMSGSFKEQRSISRGRSSVPRQRPAASIATLETTAPAGVKKPVIVPGGVRWSTSTMPRSKISAFTSSSSSNTSNRLQTDVSAAAAAGTVNKAMVVVPEVVVERRRSSGGSRVFLDKSHPQMKKKGAGFGTSNPIGKENTHINSKGFHGEIRVSEDCKVNNSFSRSHSTKEDVPRVVHSSARKERVASSVVSNVRFKEAKKTSFSVNLKSQALENGLKKEFTEKHVDKGCLLLPNLKSNVDERTASVIASESCNERNSKNVAGCSTVPTSGGVLENHKKKASYEVPGFMDVNENPEITAVSAPKSSVHLKAAVSGNVIEQKSDQNGVVHLSTKHSSKVQENIERLAFLEGKVQRIAADIERTKEKLDLNNPDASKIILNDIQTKILGIEKAVGHVMLGTEEQIGIVESFKESGTSVARQVKNPSKQPVIPMNSEELEARFFPHHRLLRSRMPPSDVVEGGGHVKSDDPIEENPVALEFLASLNVDYSKVNTRNRINSSGVPVIQQKGSENNSSTSVNCPAKATTDGNVFTSNEKLDAFDEQENKNIKTEMYDSDDSSTEGLFNISHKPSTGGWFVSEGEAVLLAHSDGSCSYYDIANVELKSQYVPPPSVPTNIWGDCWLIRAPGADGSAGRYVVAASAGNALDSGFCSWDFYNKHVQAFRLEERSSLSSRTMLAPHPNPDMSRNSLCCSPVPGNQQWWYRPCGYLIASACTKYSVVSAFDVRDGGLAMTWPVQNPIASSMENSSPLQWRSRGKMVVAETEALSLWDVNSLNPQPLLSVACSGKKLSALHVNNTDAEIGGGVRQRVSSSEIEGNDGVFCTEDSINVFDFRLPSGVGLKISKDASSSSIHSVYSRGDSIFVGSRKPRSLTVTAAAHGGGPGVQHFSIRKGTQIATYSFPDVKTHLQNSSITQVWGNSNLVMGISGMGLFVYDNVKDRGMQQQQHHSSSVAGNGNNLVQVRESIGSNDLHSPSFDYHGERVLVISRDHPAIWRYLS